MLKVTGTKIRQIHVLPIIPMVAEWLQHLSALWGPPEEFLYKSIGAHHLHYTVWFVSVQGQAVH